MERVLTKLGVRSLFLLTTLFVLTQTSLATTAVRPSDDDMIIGARAIVRGKIVSIESAFDEKSRRIYTYITVKVQEVIKGKINERRIVLRELGGQAGERAMAVYGNPEFRQKERVFLYLDTWTDGSLRTYQMFLGKFTIERDALSGKMFVNRAMQNDHVVVLPPPDAGRGVSTDRMELDAYTEMVRLRSAVNEEASRAFEARYYSGISLRAEPAEFSRVSLEGGVSAQYTFLNPQARWFEPDTGQPVSYIVNPTPSSVPGFPPLSVPATDVAAAANAWSSVSGCALRVTFGGQQSDCYTDTGTPGINVVSNNCDGRNGATTSCSGILAWGGWSGGTWETKVIGGISFRRITQGFISFNPYAACYFSDHCDVQEITTHEMGHALGLGHSADSTATMYAYAHFDGRCASIKSDDAAGITFVYPGSGGGPGPLTITTTSLPNGIVGAAYNQALIASGGTLPYTWSLVAGQGALPSGLILSSDGVVSGTPTASGTSNFTVKVTDAGGANVQKALSLAVTSGGTPLDSQFVSQNVPTTLQPGQSFNANLKFLNIGTQTWSGSAYWLASQNPAFNLTWGGNGVSLSSYSIAPGQQLDLTFTAFAPLTPGTYNFQWQLYQNGGVGYFGQMSTNIQVNVGAVQTQYQGFHDAAGCNTISGWAWDANNPDSTVSVDIYDGATLIGTTPANMYREDLLNAVGSPSHGFSFLTPVSLKDGATHTINVKISGTSTLLGNTGRTIHCSLSPSLWGRHDGQGCNAIEGWAWDANDPNGTVNVDIYDGSNLIATVEATLYRQDLADALGSPYHGFIFHTPASLRDGQPHTITVKFGGSSINLPLDTPRTTSCSSSTPNYQGTHDVADCNWISGYAWDANDDQGTINAAIYVDGSFVVVVPAQQAYPGIGTGYHGFKFAVPASLKNGQQHSIQVRFSGTATNLTNSPKLLACP